MNLLLDSHIIPWYLNGDPRLRSDWRANIASTRNITYVSVVSIWEIAIKYSLGKMPLPSPPAIYLPRQRELHGMRTLPLLENALARLTNLPNIHRDPFDRMLIAQALTLDLTLVTADAVVQAYPVNRLT